MTIREQIHAELEKARTIDDAARKAGRQMTREEAAQAESHLKTVEGLKRQLEDVDGQAQVRAALDSLNGATPNADRSPAAGAGFKARAAAQWAKKADDAIRTAMVRGTDGVKALISGSVGVPSIIGEIVQTPLRPLSLLDLIAKPNSPATGNGREFSFLRQSARTNNAAAVPDGGIKPVSVSTFVEIRDYLRTYANLSEPFPIRYLEDHNGIIDVLRVQLAENVLEQIEDDIIAGTGTGDAFTGIVTTSGIQTSAFATDLLTSLNNAKWAALNASVDITGWVLAPGDVQKLELLREGGATGGFLFKGRAEIENWLGAPYVTNMALPIKTALVGDWRTVELLSRGGTRVDVDTAGTLFQTNSAQLRVEDRVGLKIGRPGAIVKVGTAA